MCHVIREVKFGVKSRSKSHASKRADSGIFLIEMKSLGNFLQNDPKFVEIPLVIAEISQFEFWRVPSFFAKTPIFKGAYLQNYSSDLKNTNISSTSKPSFMQIGDGRVKCI